MSKHQWTIVEGDGPRRPYSPRGEYAALWRELLLRLLHDLRANTEALLVAAWDGADYTLTDATGRLAQERGWITPAHKWVGDSPGTRGVGG